jgi:hypothetical protein
VELRAWRRASDAVTSFERGGDGVAPTNFGSLMA